MRFVFALAALVCLHDASAQPALRLDGSARPTRYALDLTVDPDKEQFSGIADIHVDLQKPASTIWLHASGLKITAATVRTKQGRQTATARHSGEFLGIDTPAVNPAGLARLRLEYTGSISRKGHSGMFAAKDNGLWYVFTQFEALEARRAFPSFDEPGWKTPFTVTLRVPASSKAYSNSPVVQETNGTDGFRVVRFAETPPLPTYLVAFAVGPFEEVSAGVAGRNKTPLRILVPKGRAAQAEYARQASPKLFTALEDYFGIPYPYAKLDQIAIPVTQFGAMENAGLITYAEKILLSPQAGDSQERQRMSETVIAHEMAHHWFGDLVTMQWWDDLWLNEAFASWVETVAVDKVHPEWDVWAGEMPSKERAMAVDSLTSARRIRQPIERDADIEQAFDSITYLKGAAVIRMFENWIGPDVFRRGITRYLNAHRHANATSREFLAAISAEAGRDIAPAFSSFLDRGGIPLLRVNMQCGAGKGATIDLRQERYLPAGSKGDGAMYWQAPVCFRYEAGGKAQRHCVLASDPQQTVNLPGVSGCPAWLTADENGAGYYRVLYTGPVPRGGATLAERASAAWNTATLFRGGYLDLPTALAEARQMAQSNERQVVEAALNILGGLEWLDTPETKPRRQRFAASLFAARGKALGWTPRPGENPDDTLLRPYLASIAVIDARDPEMEREARRLAEAWLRDRSAVDPSVADAALGAAAAVGDRALLDACIKAVESEPQARHRGTLIGALSSFEDPALVRAALDWAAQGRPSIVETKSVIQVYGMRPDTSAVAWDFVKANFDRIAAQLPKLSAMDPGSTLIEAASGLCDASARADVARFFEPKAAQMAGARRELDQTLERIDLCIARRSATKWAPNSVSETSIPEFNGMAAPREKTYY